VRNGARLAGTILCLAAAAVLARKAQILSRE
jgi:hypothetical protein